MAQDQQAWNNAANFYEKLLTKYKEDVSKQLSDRVGPDFRARWTQWTRRDQNQEARNQIQFELRRLLASEPNHGAQLASDEFTAIRKNLGLLDCLVLIQTILLVGVFYKRPDYNFYNFLRHTPTLFYKF